MATSEGKKQPVEPKHAVIRPQYSTSLNQGRVLVLKGRLRRGRL